MHSEDVSSANAPQPEVLVMEMSLPHDMRLAAAIRTVAMQVAQFAGCAEERAEAFAQSIEALVRAQLEQAADGSAVPVILRLTTPPQIEIASQVITLDV
jgi:hypothetical protein